jgi:hypothetical protein
MSRILSRLSWAVWVLCLLVPLMTASTVAMSQTRIQSLSFAEIPLRAGERIVGFQLSLTAARVHSLREIPLGWQISVDNDASWNTEIRGAATVGAAALDAAFFNKLCFIETADASIPAFSAEATFIVTADFQAQRDIVVGTDNVIVAPR